MTRLEYEEFMKVKDEIVRRAVSLADCMIIDGCLGNPEALMLLTMEVSQAFNEKVLIMLRTETYKKQILCEVAPEALWPSR